MHLRKTWYSVQASDHKRYIKAHKQDITMRRIGGTFVQLIFLLAGKTTLRRAAQALPQVQNKRHRKLPTNNMRHELVITLDFTEYYQLRIKDGFKDLKCELFTGRQNTVSLCEKCFLSFGVL